MAVPEVITKLIERFDFHRQSYIGPRSEYNETKLRQDYLDHFFIALGWDVYNNQGWSEQYREVSLEQPIKIKGTTEFIDYTFKIGKDIKFIAEAKAPKVRIKGNTDAAYQVRRYSWNAQQPLCILTNFDEFSVYDCTMKPSSSDSQNKGEIKRFTYKDIPNEWDWLVSIFSKEAILRGSFDRFAEATKGKKGTASVDDEFLTEIETWRENLAKNLALRNTSLSVDELNFSVQAIIDRIIFLRICEDRGLEKYETLKSINLNENIYPHIYELFKKADIKYNSGIFYFRKEPDREEPDTLTPSLHVDDKILRDIIKRLYYPDSPYEFSIIPPEILGQVYEQFLGKVIRLTEGHQAKIEYKPEVKKAGGVYYTPKYVVDYIVKHTVGEIIKNKNPKEVSKIKILDPACGSGSFLLGAYQYLLDWHQDWYIRNLVPVFREKNNNITDPAIQALLPEPPKKKKMEDSKSEFPIYNTGYSEGTNLLDRTRSDWILTITERKRILLNNIFGVDVDHQAVEVTKLSLLLKVLEGENEQDIETHLKLFAERALPSLHQNIKCGNSLVSTDVISPDIPPNELKQINPFNWEREFTDIIKTGGFDAVIGNPPYGAEFSPAAFEYIQNRFNAQSKSIDSYELFLVKASQLLNIHGFLSMIIPFSWVTAEKYLGSRRLLIEKLKPVTVLGMPFDVFKNAYIDTSIIVFSHDDRIKECKIHYFPKKEKLKLIPDEIGHDVPLDRIVSDPLIRFTPIFSINLNSILTKLKSSNNNFGKWFKIQRGVQPYSRAKHSEKQIKERFLHSKRQLSSKWLPELQGNELSRYYVEPERVSFLHYCEDIASNREIEMFQGPRIALRRLLTRKFRLQASFVKDTMITTDNVLNLIPLSQETDILFALGILNSRIISWYYVNTSSIAQKDDFPQVHLSALKELPIPESNPKARERIKELVTQMLDLNNKLQTVRIEQDKTMLSRQIEAVDNQIDTLVYELYGLTEKETKSIQGC
jgi:type I restriction-modification system DNA methylase subunit